MFSSTRVHTFGDLLSALSSVFHVVVCVPCLVGCVLSRFDTFWMSKEPENIMAYPKLKEEFLQELRSEVDSGNILLTLKS